MTLCEWESTPDLKFKKKLVQIRPTNQFFELKKKKRHAPKSKIIIAKFNKIKIFITKQIWILSPFTIKNFTTLK